MDIDALWEPKTHQTSWLDGLTTEQQDWLGEVAAAIRERGREPTSWPRVLAVFADQWPDAAPKQHSTVRTAVRRLVKS